MTNHTTPLIADMVARTEEGTAALTRAVARATTDPARAAFLATAAINVGAELAGATKLSKYANTVLYPLLVASEGVRFSTVIDAIVGAVGQWEKATTPEQPSVGGILGVMGIYLNYITDSDPKQINVAPVIAAAYAGVWGAGTLLAATKSRAHLPAVALGGAMVSTTAAIMQNPRLRADVTTQGVSHGANLALASEGITFAKNLLPAKNAFLRRMANTAEAGLYAVGHLLLKDGLK